MLTRAVNLKNCSGQSLTEFALMLPLLIVVLLGVLEVAHIYQAYVTITNAAREGARYGIEHPTDNTGIKNHAVQEGSSEIPLNTGNVNNPVCTAIASGTGVACAGAQNGDKITVTVNFNYQFITTYLFGVGQMTISNNATMAITNGAP